jgi:hypothetical protein
MNDEDVFEEDNQKENILLFKKKICFKPAINGMNSKMF